MRRIFFGIWSSQTLRVPLEAEFQGLSDGILVIGEVHRPEKDTAVLNFFRVIYCK